MFRIRRVPDDSTAANAAAVQQVQDILAEQFAQLDRSEIAALPGKLRDPFKYRFRPLLFVAEDAHRQVRGFALVLHATDLSFCYLDFMATRAGRSGGGIGSALYERVREEAMALAARGLYFECLPDDPALSRDPRVRAQNARRLRFYERYGARPLANTAYETPLEEGGDNPPYLVYDAVGRPNLPRREEARAVVRAILERKYGDLCPPEYVTRVVSSIRDDPIVLRAPRYRPSERPQGAPSSGPAPAPIPLVVNDKHDIHHVRERGYVEAPVRISSILKELERSGMFRRIEPRHFADSHVRGVHDGRLLDYLQRACAQVGTGRSIYPYVFPIRNQARPPRDLPLRAGYFCIDTFTPINGNAYLAARRAVDCALTAADQVLAGGRLAYALVRPPGHHAERSAFGGFCYFNNSACAAHYLSRYGRVAVLDIDYHHGNGTQEIFYERSDVLTVSIHGHPSFAYPYFSGFREEEGRGAGTGYNLNLPLAEDATSELYREALDKALRRITRFAPTYLVVAAGFDTAAGDPTGSWSNRAQDFADIGHAIGNLGYPTVVIQEGGYRVRTLGANVRRFFEALVHSLGRARRTERAAKRAAPPVGSLAVTAWREGIRAEDVESVRALAGAAGVFSSAEEEIAAELVAERLQRGPQSGYHFLLAERGGHLVGYACFGPIPGTEGRFDLYWIVVHPDHRRGGLGRELIRRSEAAVRALGGTRMFIDTSSSERYRPARSLYRRQGYRKVAELRDFFREGDGKVIYAKDLSA